MNDPDRYAALIAERYGPPVWWEHPDAPDTPTNITARRRAAVTAAVTTATGPRVPDRRWWYRDGMVWRAIRPIRKRSTSWATPSPS